MYQGHLRFGNKLFSKIGNHLIAASYRFFVGRSGKDSIEGKFTKKGTAASGFMAEVKRQPNISLRPGQLAAMVKRRQKKH